MKNVDLMAAITDNFRADFENSYKSLRRKGKKRLLPHIASFYRRWFYSAFVEDTLLSPANLWDALDKRRKSVPGGVALPILLHAENAEDITFALRQYDINNHPIFGDIALLMESCSPDFAFGPGEELTEEHERMLLEKLSINDPYYASYLVLLCIHMNLIAKIPSIHSNRAQVTKEFDAFSALEGRGKLDAIVTAAAGIAASFISEIIPARSDVDREYIVSLLKKPVSTDDIFKHIYSAVGLNIEDIMDYQEDLMSEMAGAMLSSTFYLGVIMDKYFFTPFGFYMKLINPGYLLPYYMKREMTFALEALNEADDISIAMFSPCSHYNLTGLGREYFGAPGSESAGIISGDVPLDGLVTFLTSNMPMDGKALNKLDMFFKESHMHEDSRRVYQIKARLAEDRAVWKTFEFTEDTTLHDIYYEICYEFNFDVTMEYSFYRTEEESPFMEYSPPLRRKKAKNSSDADLSYLGFPEKHKFLLVLHDVASPFSGARPALPQKSVRLELEIMKIKDADAGHLYPRVAKTGKKFKEYYTEWMF